MYEFGIGIECRFFRFADYLCKASHRTCCQRQGGDCQARSTRPDSFGKNHLRKAAHHPTAALHCAPGSAFQGVAQPDLQTGSAPVCVLWLPKKPDPRPRLAALERWQQRLGKLSHLLPELQSKKRKPNARRSQYEAPYQTSDARFFHRSPTPKGRPGRFYALLRTINPASIQIYPGMESSEPIFRCTVIPSGHPPPASFSTDKIVRHRVP